MLTVNESYSAQIADAVKQQKYVLSFQLVDQRATDRAEAKRRGCAWAWI